MDNLSVDIPRDPNQGLLQFIVWEAAQSSGLPMPSRFLCQGVLESLKVHGGGFASSLVNFNFV